MEQILLLNILNMIRKNKPSVAYANNSINRSPSKEAHSFGQAERFMVNKSHSPNRFYDIPDGLSKRATGIGFGNKKDIILKDLNEPARYFLKSEFDQIAEGYRYGRRPEKETLKKDYSFQKIRERTDSSAYLNRELTENENKEKESSKGKGKGKERSRSRLGSPDRSQKVKLADKSRAKSYCNLQNAGDKQSQKRKSAYRLQYEYSHNYLLNDNRTSYTEFLPKKEEKVSKGEVQGKGGSRQQRMRVREEGQLGPGSYNVFSEFGDNLRIV